MKVLQCLGGILSERARENEWCLRVEKDGIWYCVCSNLSKVTTIHSFILALLLHCRYSTSSTSSNLYLRQKHFQIPLSSAAKFIFEALYAMGNTVLQNPGKQVCVRACMCVAAAVSLPLHHWCPGFALRAGKAHGRVGLSHALQAWFLFLPFLLFSLF